MSISVPEFNHERFLSKVLVDELTGCWNWTGYVSKKGYGNFSIKYKTYLAHRVSYSFYVGFKNDDSVIDHKCRNKKCVNHDHLREVTQKVNVIENSLSIQAENSAKTHCKNGHELSGNNLSPRKTMPARDCRICRNARNRARYKRNKNE